MTAWYPIKNDLAGGYAIGNRDKPLSQYDFRASLQTGDYVIADGMREDDATGIAALLNLHGHPDRAERAARAGEPDER